MPLKVLYPWQSLKTDEGFFVPSLDTEHTRGEGIRQGLRQGMRYPAGQCVIKDGQTGVWFYLTPRARQSPA